MKRCPYCAEEIQDSTIVCPHCGRNLSTQPPEEQKPSTQQTSRTPKRYVLAIGAIAISMCCYIIALLGFIGAFVLFSHAGEIFTLLVDLPTQPNEKYSTVTPMPTATSNPTATPVDATTKQVWLNWKNLEITITEQDKKCVEAAVGIVRISGTIKNNNSFEVKNLKIKGFSCPWGTPCIYGDKSYLSDDENTIDYITKVVTPFPLPIKTENIIEMKSLPPGAVESFLIDITNPSKGNYYCDAIVVDFSR